MTDSRNVVLITADSIRADHCVNSDRKATLTPKIDELAADGTVFDAAISPGPRTMSSVPSMHTGEPFPLTEHDGRAYTEKADRIRRQIENHTTIAERFKEQGYTTIGFSANPWTSKDVNFDRGFDIYEEVAGESRSHVPELFEGTALGGPIRIFSQWRNNDIWFSQWPTFFDEIVSTVEDVEEPYFLWVFLIDSHNPYLVPRADRIESSTPGMYYGVLGSNKLLTQRSDNSSLRSNMPDRVERHLKRAYRDSIRSVDRFVGELDRELGDDDPVLAFHSDHGEAFGEHGSYGHHRQLYEENIRVPLVIHGTERQSVVKDPVSLLKLPDILDAAKDGALVPAEMTDDVTFARTEDSETVAVRTEEWKYIRSGSDEELYHLPTDPAESENRVERDSDVRDEYADILDTHLESLPEATVQGDEDRDSMVESRLKSLGYM